MSASVTRGTALAGGPAHAGADFTVPNDVFRTDSHVQVPFNNEEIGRPRPDRVGRGFAIAC
jgi:hypothetical protein